MHYLCICECGNEVNVRQDKLKNKITRSCGCLRKVDLTGKVFGRLTVVRGVARNKRGYYHCNCSCGNKTLVRGDSLQSGLTKSCGCWQYENGLLSETHGKSHTRIYNIYQKMKERCYNPKNERYERYGGRGIIVCDQWLDDFMNFYNWAEKNGYKETLSIDRINNDGNYKPSNCRWATDSEQANNRNNNVIINYKGKEYTRAELSRFLNIDYELIRRRLGSGYSVGDIVKEIEISKGGFGSSGR